MSSYTPINTGLLLAPISPEVPGGQPLLNSEPLARLKQLRAVERQMVDRTYPGALRPANWRPVIVQAEQILTSDCKDLQVAVWLLEACLHQGGFSGLRDGLELLDGLHSQHWQHLHPAAEEGDKCPRLRWLSWLEHSSFTGALGLVPLVPAHGDRPALTLNDHRLSRKAGGRITAADFDAAADAVPAAHWSALALELRGCEEAFARLSAQLISRYAGRAPRLLAIAGCIEQARSLVEPRCPQEAAPCAPLPPIDTEAPPATAAGAHMAEPLELPTQADQGHAPDLLAAVRSTMRSGAVVEGLAALQRAVDQAGSRRQRFLLRLVLAEVCIELDLVQLAAPLLTELLATALERRVEEWEGPQISARLCAARLAALEAPALNLSSDAAALFQQLCRVDMPRAHRHLLTLNGAA